MLTNFMKCVSIAVLLLAIFWRSSSSYQLVLQFVVCASAVMVAWEAYRKARHLWFIGFAAIAMLFNPVQSFEFPFAKFLWLDLICLTAFAWSLAALKAKSNRAGLGSFMI